MKSTYCKDLFVCVPGKDVSSTAIGFRLLPLAAARARERWFAVFLSYFHRGASPTSLSCSPRIIFKYVPKVPGTADNHLAPEPGACAGCEPARECMSCVLAHTCVRVCVCSCTCGAVSPGPKRGQCLSPDAQRGAGGDQSRSCLKPGFPFTHSRQSIKISRAGIFPEGARQSTFLGNAAYLNKNMSTQGGGVLNLAEVYFPGCLGGGKCRVAFGEPREKS